MFKYFIVSSEEDAFYAVNMGVYGLSVSSMNVGFCKLHLEQYGSPESLRVIDVYASRSSGEEHMAYRR